jgi:hypothetical protein
MRDVETTAEYEVSKALLLEWSVSTQVVVAVGTNISQNLRRWIVKKILPYVPKTLLAHRLKRRTFMDRQEDPTLRSQDYTCSQA